MMTYAIDRPLRGPEELGESGGVPADWHTELVDRGHSPAHYILLQFGSINVNRAEAEKIVQGILVGLNSGAAS